MRIGIDISQIIYETGVSVYTRNLVKNILLQDTLNDYILFGGSLRRMGDFDKFLLSFKGNFQKKLLPFPPTLARTIWNDFHLLPPEAFLGRLDVFHSSDWAQPPGSHYKVTTVHDLAPIKFPGFTHPRNVSTHKARLYWVKKEVDCIIAPSESTKRDLVEFGIEKERIKVIYEALDEYFKVPSRWETEKTLKKYKIGGRFALAVGTSKRKNLDNIIKAFFLAKEKLQLDKLVIIGEHRQTYSDFVQYVGFVEQKDYPAFYSKAEVFVYPSLFEGFGLPILEAFYCSCPVVTSNLSSMPEVAGNAAILVDPYEVESIAEGIQEALKKREKLIKLGKERVKTFSWDKAAKETIKIYSQKA